MANYINDQVAWWVMYEEYYNFGGVHSGPVDF
jgi:hypothetical protein